MIAYEFGLTGQYFETQSTQVLSKLYAEDAPKDLELASLQMGFLNILMDENMCLLVAIENNDRGIRGRLRDHMQEPIESIVEETYYLCKAGEGVGVQARRVRFLEDLITPTMMELWDDQENLHVSSILDSVSPEDIGCILSNIRSRYTQERIDITPQPGESIERLRQIEMVLRYDNMIREVEAVVSDYLDGEDSAYGYFDHLVLKTDEVEQDKLVEMLMARVEELRQVYGSSVTEITETDEVQTEVDVIGEVAGHFAEQFILGEYTSYNFVDQILENRHWMGRLSDYMGNMNLPIQIREMIKKNIEAYFQPYVFTYPSNSIEFAKLDAADVTIDIDTGVSFASIDDIRPQIEDSPLSGAIEVNLAEARNTLQQNTVNAILVLLQDRGRARQLGIEGVDESGLREIIQREVMEISEHETVAESLGILESSGLIVEGARNRYVDQYMLREVGAVVEGPSKPSLLEIEQADQQRELTKFIRRVWCLSDLATKPLDILMQRGLDQIREQEAA